MSMAEYSKCPMCGTPGKPGAIKCLACGEKLGRRALRSHRMNRVVWGIWIMNAILLSLGFLVVAAVAVFAAVYIFMALSHQ